MRLKIECNEQGDPLSRLALELDRQQLEFVSETDTHILQALGSATRSFSNSLGEMVSSLEATITAGAFAKPSGSVPAAEAFRRLVYDATEVFDIFAKVLPERISAGGDKTRLRLVRDYAATAKRLRDPCAMLCNKFKHSSYQLGQVQGSSQVNFEEYFGWVAMAYAKGEALLVATDIHKKPERSVAYVRSLHGIVHAILRSDVNAARLATSLSLGELPPTERPAFPFRVGESLRRLWRIPLIVLQYEPTMFDGFEFAPNWELSLSRCRANRLREPSRRSTSLPADGVTKIFQFV